MSAVVLSIPADRIEWGPLLAVGEYSSLQTGKLYRGEEQVLSITLQWPTPEPVAAVVCHIDGRDGGARD